MSLFLYCWVVGDLYDSKHVTVVAKSSEEALDWINRANIIKVEGDYHFDLNEVCTDKGNNYGYTWKKIISDTDPKVHEIKLREIFAFQYGSG